MEQQKKENEGKGEGRARFGDSENMELKGRQPFYEIQRTRGIRERDLASNGINEVSMFLGSSVKI